MPSGQGETLARGLAFQALEIEAACHGMQRTVETRGRRETQKDTPVARLIWRGATRTYSYVWPA